GETYRVLWYRLHPGKILVRGINGNITIPFIPYWEAPYNDGIPLAPLAALVPLKLRGWTDHCDCDEWYQRKKRWNDIADLEELVQIAVNEGVWINREKETWLALWFVQEAKQRVQRFVRELPYAGFDWKAIGLV
ncbi:hypothetical protein SERLADRAFT_479043, partial [Serpula lacrymans var. lacrymans S7.9]